MCRTEEFETSRLLVTEHPWYIFRPSEFAVPSIFPRPSKVCRVGGQKKHWPLILCSFLIAHALQGPKHRQNKFAVDRCRKDSAPNFASRKGIGKGGGYKQRQKTPKSLPIQHCSRLLEVPLCGKQEKVAGLRLMDPPRGGP